MSLLLCQNQTVTNDMFLLCNDKYRQETESEPNKITHCCISKKGSLNNICIFDCVNEIIQDYKHER